MKPVVQSFLTCLHLFPPVSISFTLRPCLCFNQYQCLCPSLLRSDLVYVLTNTSVFAHHFYASTLFMVSPIPVSMPITFTFRPCLWFNQYQCLCPSLLRSDLVYGLTNTSVYAHLRIRCKSPQV